MKEEEIKKLNIYERMSLITNEIGVVEKNLKIDVTKTRSYKAVSERDVIDAIKPLEEKYRVYSYPVSRTVTDKDVLTKETDYGTTNSLFMRVETIYRFVNIDKPDEYIETIVYGDGIDTGDKAPGKAMTYADKYALMKAYKLSTGDDPDNEASPAHGYKKTNNVSKTNDKGMLISLIDKLEIETNTDHEKMLKHYGVESNIDMSIEQLQDAKHQLEMKLKKQKIENLEIPVGE